MREEKLSEKEKLRRVKFFFKKRKVDQKVGFLARARKLGGPGSPLARHGYAASSTRGARHQPWLLALFVTSPQLTIGKYDAATRAEPPVLRRKVANYSYNTVYYSISSGKCKHLFTFYYYILPMIIRPIQNICEISFILL
jgi:hypothetical protein